MQVIARLEAALRVARVVLVLALVGAIVGGLLLFPPPPVGYAAVEGQPLLRRSGTGPAAGSRPVGFGQHAIGVGIRCDGLGTLRVELHPFGAVESPCVDRDTSGGGCVFSDIAGRSTSWQEVTRRSNRWSLVLTRPVSDGTGWHP